MEFLKGQKNVRKFCYTYMCRYVLQLSFYCTPWQSTVYKFDSVNFILQPTLQVGTKIFITKNSYTAEF